MPTRPNPLVFLSSTLRGRQVPGLKEERRRIYEHGLQYGDNAVWVDECSHPRDTTTADPLESVDDLLKEIERSQLYLVLVGTDWAGSEIEVAGQKSQVSFFEMELFYAAMRGRPIIVVERSDIAVPARTADVLALMRRTLPQSHWYTAHSIQDAESLCEYFVDRCANGELGNLAQGQRQYASLLLGLWKSLEKDREGEHIEWLRGALLPTQRSPNVGVIEGCLNDAGQLYSHQARLSRIWIAARELMGVPWLDEQHDEWLPYWDRVFAAWNKAAGWYGLHGHVDLGYLAAVNSMESVRRRWKLIGEVSADDPAWDPPFSSQASAYYALARRVGSLRYRYRGMRRALDLVDKARPQDVLGRSNVLSIRASILKGLGAFPAANKAYEEVVRLREQAGASDGAIGEALSELGFGLLHTLHWLRGRSLLHAGIAMMRRAEYSPGFLVRALRKEAIACRLLGRFAEARGLDEQARELANIAAVARMSWKR